MGKNCTCCVGDTCEVYPKGFPPPPNPETEARERQERDLILRGWEQDHAGRWFPPAGTPGPWERYCTRCNKEIMADSPDALLCCECYRKRQEMQAQGSIESGIKGFFGFPVAEAKPIPKPQFSDEDHYEGPEKKPEPRKTRGGVWPKPKMQTFYEGTYDGLFPTFKLKQGSSLTKARV